MPQPESPIPDIKKELAEVADAQDIEVETQKSRFAELECAKQRVNKEAEDVLRMAYENSEDPEKFILEVVEDYAKDEGISLLAAKARVLQYLSPEWKEKVDAEVREYFEKFDLSEFVTLPEGSEETDTLLSLCDEGYMPMFVIAVHYQGSDVDKKKRLADFSSLLVRLKNVAENVEKESFNKKESFVLDPGNSFPEAIKYLEGMKREKSVEEYEYAIGLVYKYLVLGRGTEGEFPEFDCDETTLFLQKIATDASLEIGNYMSTWEHVVLRIDGLPLVLDTRDRKIRTVEECARQTGYGDGFHGSYFWRDGREDRLAQYEKSDHYPRKILKYEKVEKPSLVGLRSDVINLLRGRAALLFFKGDVAGAQLHYEKALEINPNCAEAHYNFAYLLNAKGDVAGAQLHYEKALEINPNYAEAHNNLAFLLSKKGDVVGVQSHYERALEINPNYAEAHNNLAFLLYERGKLEEARRHLDAFAKLRNGKYEGGSQWLNEELKEKGY